LQQLKKARDRAKMLQIKLDEVKLENKTDNNYTKNSGALLRKKMKRPGAKGNCKK
jgi:hypothetical protein